MLSLSCGSLTMVCVCEPRHVCTFLTTFGCAGSEMSTMRTPRKRSMLTVSVMLVVPQSLRDPFDSPEMNIRLPYTDGSPWLAGQRNPETSFGAFGFAMSQI